nr:hypothetical protein [Spodoptera exigua multiple nucleopolyhedrovirus]
MNNITEALQVARQLESARLYNKAAACYNLAIHFLTLLKSKKLNRQLLEMCDRKILHCVRERNRIIKLNKQIVLKKYVLIK